MNTAVRTLAAIAITIAVTTAAVAAARDSADRPEGAGTRAPAVIIAADPVPRPGTLALLGLGLVVVGILRRHGRRM